MREVKYLSIIHSTYYNTKKEPVKCVILEEAIGPYNSNNIYKILEEVNDSNYIKKMRSCKTIIKVDNVIIDKFTTYPNCHIKQKEKEIKKDILKRTTCRNLNYVLKECI